MGDDDGVCGLGPGGVHDLQLSDLVLNQTGGGMAQIRTCTWCGEQAYEASAADEARRPALGAGET